MNIKTRARELWKEHQGIASSNPRLFRKTIMDTLIQEFGCSVASAATQYNNVKNESAPVDGLGRASTARTVRRAAPGRTAEPEVDDDDCFSLVELIKKDSGLSVGRTRTFILQGDASESFDSAVTAYPNSSWVMLQGLGPMHGETYRLRGKEKEIRRYDTAAAPVAQKTYVFTLNNERVDIRADSRSEAVLIFEDRYPEQDSTIIEVQT